jgi:predicted kinase
MRQLLMTIGMPFSGKSTAAAEYRTKNGWMVISRDSLIPVITKSPEWNTRVLAECHAHQIDAHDLTANFGIRNEVTLEMLNEAISSIIAQHEEHIFYDGTNLQKSGRAMLMKLKSDNLEIHGVYFDVPMEELIARAQKVQHSGEREGAFNADAVKRLEQMARMFEEPSLEEGFTSLTRMSEFSEPHREAQLEFNKPLR